jgi:hypothetical protein
MDFELPEWMEEPDLFCSKTVKERVSNVDHVEILIKVNRYIVISLF